jgi:hypothetical protein
MGSRLGAFSHLSELRAPFDGFVEKAVRATTTCLITADHNRTASTPAPPGGWCWCAPTPTASVNERCTIGALAVFGGEVSGDACLSLPFWVVFTVGNEGSAARLENSNLVGFHNIDIT